MLCDEISSYPTKVDEMTFFQDVSLTTTEYMNEYQRLLSQGNYSEANNYINRQNGLYGYFACFFNMLENRIYALQDYLPQKEKVNHMVHQNEEPNNAIAKKTVWTGGHIKYEKPDIAPEDVVNNWNYSLDSENGNIILNSYCGTEKDIIIYANYEIDGIIYKTKIPSNTFQDNKYMFYRNETVETIKFNTGVDTSDVTDMSYMFYHCNHLHTIDLSSFNTSNVTNMSNMFSGCINLVNLDLSNFDTSNVTDMSGMFYYYRGTTLDLSNFNTSNVTDMGYMFESCSNLTLLDLSSFDTNMVTTMYGMFQNAKSLNKILVSREKWNTPTTSIGIMNMFEGCGTSYVTYK